MGNHSRECEYCNDEVCGQKCPYLVYEKARDAHRRALDQYIGAATKVEEEALRAAKAHATIVFEALNPAPVAPLTPHEQRRFDEYQAAQRALIRQATGVLAAVPAPPECDARCGVNARNARGEPYPCSCGAAARRAG